jgi:hypothetical protein
MTTTLMATRVPAIAKTLTRNLLAMLALGMLFTACKKDDDNPGNPNDPNNPGGEQQSYFPAKTNGVWKYRMEDDGEITEQTLRMVSQKDSAGGKVYHYKMSFDDGTEVNPFVHVTPSKITYANPLPVEMQEVIDGLQNDPDVSDFEISGFPMLQHLPANPKAGDVVNFSEGLSMSWTQHDEDDEYPVAMSFRFSNGKILGFEDVTTPAGTFKNAVKWEYKGTLTMQIGAAAPQVTEIRETSWYAKGVGPVKSAETGGATSSTTTLVAIQ